jgi:hypothetical protein
MRQVLHRVLQVYELSCGRTGLQYVAPPPPGVPAAALLSAAVSRALGCPLPLPLSPLFDCGEALLETVQGILLPSRGTPLAHSHVSGAWCVYVLICGIRLL